MKKAWVIAAVVVVAIAANAAVWMTSVKPGSRDGLWSLMESSTVPLTPDVAPVFDAALRAQEGKRVSLSGVAFVMKDGAVSEASPDGGSATRAATAGPVSWFLLLPPSKYGCCGISCDPRPEMSVYVDCTKSPWASGGRQQVLVTVEGTLRLQRSAGSWCFYTLEDASVRPEE